MISNSTKALWKLHAGQGFLKRPYLFAYAYIYLAYTYKYVYATLTLAKFVFNYLPRKAGAVLLSFFIPGYHAKILVTEDAKKIVSLNEDLWVDDRIGEKIVPFDLARQILLKNPDSIISTECACRMYTKKTTGTCCSTAKYGIRGCLTIGEPQASFVLEHSTLNPKKLTVEEALEQLEEYHENRWIHTLWFRDVLGYRSYAMCNCCTCCCGAMITNNKLAPQVHYPQKMILSSGYIAKTDENMCNGCLACVESCPFEARRITSSGKTELIYDKCYGCGVCIDKCPTGALSLELDPNKGIPLDIDRIKEMEAQLSG